EAHLEIGMHAGLAAIHTQPPSWAASSCREAFGVRRIPALLFRRGRDILEPNEGTAPEYGALHTLREIRLRLCSLCLCVLSRLNSLFLLSCPPNLSLPCSHAN